MEWLLKCVGISGNNIVNIPIPKEKIIRYTRTQSVEEKMFYELSNIQYIIDRAIMRDAKDSNNELHILEVALREPQYIKAIAAAFQQAIPYHKIVIFSSGDKYLLYCDNLLRNTIRQDEFSTWLYKEELAIDFNLGEERKTVHSKVPLTPQEAVYRLRHLFDVTSEIPYICVRRYLDEFRLHRLLDTFQNIRIKKDETIYILEELFCSEMIEQYGNYHFLPSSFGKETEQYGIDRKFERMHYDNFSTIDEVQRLLQYAKVLSECWDNRRKKERCVLSNEWEGEWNDTCSVMEDDFEDDSLNVLYDYFSDDDLINGSLLYYDDYDLFDDYFNKKGG